MLVYIIDAFNLIYKVSNLKNSDRPHQDLIHYIKRNKLTGSSNNKVIVVFDGNINWDLQEKDFKIVFSQKRSADEMIKERVMSINNKRQVVVVTDDREIRDAVRRQGASCCRIDDFIKVKKKKIDVQKDISYSLQREITEELRNIWLKEE